MPAVSPHLPKAKRCCLSWTDIFQRTACTCVCVSMSPAGPECQGRVQGSCKLVSWTEIFQRTGCTCVCVRVSMSPVGPECQGRVQGSCRLVSV